MLEETLEIKTFELASNVEVRQAGIGDLDSVTELALQLQRELDLERGIEHTSTELEGIKATIHSLYKFRLSGESNGLKNLVFVARDAVIQNPVGFIVGHMPYPKPSHDFYALRRGRYVLPDYRNCGISRRLAESFGEWVKRYGASHIEFEVQEGGKGEEFLTKHASLIGEVNDGASKRLRFREEI
jgi:GNAT superfamily N-acetyltransferase